MRAAAAAGSAVFCCEKGLLKQAKTAAKSSPDKQKDRETKVNGEEWNKIMSFTYR